MRDATRLDIYFKDDKALFLIPLYQRKYSWQQKHCQRLFADLVKVHEQNLYSHFFGSIVSVKASQTENDLLIIDGQQRITTISILVLAAINAVKKKDMNCEDEEFITDTCNKFLMAKYRRGVERKIKLRPIDEDMKAYDALFKNDEEELKLYKSSMIVENYRFFYNLIKAQNKRLSFEDLIRSIEKLIIIDICLDSNDNPQLIFESLNSCGKDLEEADKVRNYLLMSELPKEQEEYYYHYWSKIEKATDGEPTMFIRDYLTIKQKVISKLDDLYFDFKQYDEENGIPRRELLEDMLKFARFYRQAGKAETNSDSLNKKLRQLASIGSNVCMPFYMTFLDYAQEHQLSESTQYQVFDIIENYWARRIICGWPANVMAKTFALLHSDVMRIYKEHEKRNIAMEASYAEVMKYILLKKQGTGVFPTDTSIRENFPTRQIYKLPASYRAFLLERMENLNSREYDSNIIEKMNKGNITIEHVMPQHLSPQWKIDLGPDAEEIKEKYLHTFANLTLSGYNVEYNNRPYPEKWSGYSYTKKNRETGAEELVTVYGYKDSAFKLSNYMKSHLQWTEVELKERGEILLNNFLQLWPMPKSAYKPLEKDVEIVSLDDDDIEFTGRKIAGFRYKGERHPETIWKNLLVDVCKIIYAEKPTEMLYLASKDINLHTKSSEIYSYVADNCYVWSSNSTKSKRGILLYIFKEIGLSPSELEIELIPETETNLFDEEDE